MAGPRHLDLQEMDAALASAYYRMSTAFAEVDMELAQHAVEVQDEGDQARVQEANAALDRAWSTATWAVQAHDHGDEEASRRYRDAARAELRAVRAWWPAVRVPRSVGVAVTAMLAAARRYKRALQRAELDDCLTADGPEGLQLLCGILEARGAELGNVVPISAARAARGL